MTDKHDKLELHMGEDYAVAMLPGDTTENAAIMFGCNTEDAFCEEVVKRYNAHLDFEAQLARANRIIGWMCPYIGSMCPPDGGLADFNEHGCDNRIPKPGEETKGAPLRQSR
jgi:hypothetical protein